MTSADNNEWDEWEDSSAASSPRSPTSSCFRDHENKNEAQSTRPDSCSSDLEEWEFDLSELEQEMSTLAPAACATPFSMSDVAESSEEKIFLSLDRLPSELRVNNERMQILEALALVAHMHVISVRDRFAQLQNNAQSTHDEIKRITLELQQLAGDWGRRELLETTLVATERRQLEEMSGLLHNAMSADHEDLTLFQEVVEQLFEGFPDKKLVLSTNWLKDEREMKDEYKTDSYINQILAIRDDVASKTSRIPTLSEAEIFQDAKDIGRDELLINGERVEGKRGYDAVVDALQRELEFVLAHQVGKTPEQTPMEVSNALHSVAMAVLHACNRTESGGCSYELLTKFLSNHEVDRVLLRPASARATPLQIDLDVGPYLETILSAKEQMWAFGLRVKLTAVTWYLVCDAKDPSNELYEVETTFCNRLAFPIGLTPFHPLDNMRKDCGNVAIRLVSL
ncbi:uncharacterized protein PHALS_07494 [Plasmopara halstedii]|uniref:Uncharacterized protein n=1 Tax=Plasmopara halstedii TaxID=4781 RepID=A0A0P1B5T5_PLAHL|nr:uncharacterized protein PHALS_07494 [Plasmopara halstedii]CEG49746.1 hypothetical protein PHALS_07494 [Plasmopara halstedii]|eukprot:XP_024586115.1 hypothetical protein PHALS_07494 [Plasmopara halstedii]